MGEYVQLPEMTEDMSCSCHNGAYMMDLDALLELGGVDALPD